LLTSSSEGACDYIQADVHYPETILAGAAKTLDFNQPVALMLMGIMGLVRDDDETLSIVRRLTAPLVSGSYVAVYDGSDTDPAYVDAITRYNANSGGIPYTPRSPRQIARLLDGLEILEPGVVSVSRWRAGPSPWEEPPEVACAGGVGRKP
jgi:hypothetical protein